MPLDEKSKRKSAIARILNRIGEPIGVPDIDRAAAMFQTGAIAGLARQARLKKERKRAGMRT